MNHSKSENETKTNAYQFVFQKLNRDEPLSLQAFEGKVILIVNTASKCGFTPQYEGLEALYQRYKNKNFVVLGVPCNDFGNQEPGSGNEIGQFCAINYGVSFPMTDKVHVRGDAAHPFYVWARSKFPFWGKPYWNFHKYLIDQQGNLIDYFSTVTKPLSGRLTSKIEALLKQ